MANLLGCTCCGRPWERCPVENKRIGLRGPGRNPDNVCQECIAHAGFGLQMAKEHIPLWERYVAQVEAEGAARLAEAEGRVTRAQAELARRPERIVERYINEGDMQAVRQRRSARSSRGRTPGITCPPWGCCTPNWTASDAGAAKCAARARRPCSWTAFTVFALGRRGK